MGHCYKVLKLSKIDIFPYTHIAKCKGNMNGLYQYGQFQMLSSNSISFILSLTLVVFFQEI